MKIWNNPTFGSLKWILLFALIVFTVSSFSGVPVATAQNNNNNNNNNNDDDDDDDFDPNEYRRGYRSYVGGFSIDGTKVFREASKQEIGDLNRQIKTKMAAIPTDLDQPTELRRISLNRLDALVAKCIREKTLIPESARYLGGLTAVDYIVAVPEENDIYLVGPAEGWTINANAQVVGKKSGKPVLLLEDLITVLRANSNGSEVITCSIDPSKEALQRFAQMGAIADPAQKKVADEEAMGLMNISFSGIPDKSRMAGILAAADYRMKRISLGFEEAPVKGMPSYPSMLHKGSGSFAPRFWLEPEYATLFHDSAKLIWNIKATRVKALTEKEFFDANGTRQVAAKADPAAERWAKSMTKNFDALAKAEPVFAEAKNCMDLALVVAVLQSQKLQQRVSCAMSALTDNSLNLLPLQDAPKQVPSSSLVRIVDRRGSYISATGGVLINPWNTVRNNTQENNDLEKMKTIVAFKGNNWYAN